MAGFNTLTDLLISRKNETHQGITFILSDTVERFISYQELYQTALVYLYQFQVIGFRPGEEIIFQIEENEQFIYSFWACIMGGMIPVPVSAGTNDDHKLKLFKIWTILTQPRIIASADFIAKLESFAEKNGFIDQMKMIDEKVVNVEVIHQIGQYGEIFTSRPEDIAFIQFSSGSTGDPKGVIITHQNVLINLSSVIRWVKIDTNDIGLNWMPLTHDMGLIGTHIKALLAGINQYNLATSFFIRHPTLWLQKASEHKVTLLYSPNFGYKHFLKFFQPEIRRDWDLSRVRMIYNGAEPISLDLCNEFLDKMAPYGLKRNAMFPVYGLAEGTIAMTFPLPGTDPTALTLNRDYLKVGEIIQETTREDVKAISFVGVGYPIDNCQVQIADEINHHLGENKVGYVRIRGGNVTSGYYNNPIATELAITSDGWLNTGDLGFIRDKQLYITGRAKDIIFMTGQNFYSHDVERIAEAVDGIELGKVAATGVFNEKLKGDELILFVLFKQKVEHFIALVIQLKKVIVQTMGIEVSEVIPVKSIPKTTSGKVQRYKLRENYLNGEYDRIKHEIHFLLATEYNQREITRPQNPIEAELVKIWSEVLNIVEISTDDNFFELGGDSLRVTQLLSRIRTAFRVELDQVVLFENPEIAQLARLIEIADQISVENSESFIPLNNNSEKMLLSFGQKRLWFLDRLNKGSSQYNLYGAFRLRGRLDIRTLEKSITKIMERHQILRVSIIEENGEPLQIVNPVRDFKIPEVDLRELPESVRERKALEMARDEVRTPFELDKAPLIRGRLLILGEDEYILVLSVHHIIFDGWSFSILLRELTFYYETSITLTEQQLPEIKFQYFDYAAWQSKQLEEGLLKTHLDYWRTQLGGNLPVLDLPFEHQRPAIQTFNGAKFTFAFPAELVRQLQNLARQENATLFMVLLAAFKTLLYRYSGQEDIITGSPIANRNRKDIEDLIGFFTNNLVLRTCLTGTGNFFELLKQIKKITLEAYTHQGVPFEKLVEELHIGRDMSRNPLFQVLFSLQNTPLPTGRFSELSLAAIDIDASYARFDLALDIRDIGESLAADFEYNTDLFSQDSIVRMAGHYRRLLESIIENPAEVLDKLNILTKTEEQTLLYRWNDTKTSFNPISSWVRLFEVQTEKSPEAIAVTGGSQNLTYRELNNNANRLAYYLISRGVAPETIIGIYLDRSPEMLVALLGVHKAGGAYLPMDPIFPRERLEYMLEDAQAGIILTEKALVGTLPAHKAAVVCLDMISEEIAAFNLDNPGDRCKSGDLAYLIYTSGSTGKPKGVQIEQYALINFLYSMAEKTGITSFDRLLAVTTLSFDIAGLELLMPLTVGARVFMACREEVTDGGRLINKLDEYGITYMQATPATWRMLIDSGWNGTRGLKVLCGGEALPGDLASRLLDKCDQLWNVYGPTETTIWSTMAGVKAVVNSTIPIGKPIANTQIYVLDRLLNPVPVGIPGELYIGGDGLARGYLHLPELTTEKFIIIEQTKFQTSARLYKTGDMVRWLPDGNLEFVGRADHQVKIRGFRIELGEIEALLNHNPAIKESVVIATELIPGEKSLVAYIIPSPGNNRDELAADNLRKSLKEKLPDYMVPTTFVLLEAFPMTPNGKIDRKALPFPHNSCRQREDVYIAPSNETEKHIAVIWQEVLKLDRIGMNDNFFDLGGHSLLLGQVKNKIFNILGRDISMMDLFKYPTINTLACYLDGVNNLSPENIVYRTNRAGIQGGFAITGLSGRFPGADDITEYWDNLVNGVESINRFTDEELINADVAPELLKKPDYVKAWGVLKDADKFDALFFGYNPREAELLDPQQRVFLEEAWKALENAGYDPEQFPGLISVFASAGMNTYAQNLTDDNGSKELAQDYQIMISNDKDFLATRTAYKLNLQGPAITVQTACSSSMVAVHLACQSLANGECDIALAGGVSIRLPQNVGYLYQEGMILSPDGHCRAFDEESKGTIGGNGVGIVVLRRLEDALADGDNIYGVIRGSAVNNDGALKIGYTAPRIDGQAKAIAEAQFRSGIAPDTITYIEAHGTGTPLGDPIEMEALNQVFAKTNKKGFCGIGSVKTNIGHLDAAAGVSGLIKTILALHYKMIPPSLNYHKANPKIDFENSPFFVNANLRKWKSDNGPLRAGVSSFGIGGTNVHVILEEAPLVISKAGRHSRYLLPFSAKTPTALERIQTRLAAYLRKNAPNMADVAYTLQVGRREMEYRSFIVCNSVEDALEKLENTAHQMEQIENQEKTTNTVIPSVELSLNKYSLEELGVLWVSGAKIDWNKLYSGEKRRRVALPGYPFESKSYWVSKKKSMEKNESKFGNSRNDIPNWFYTPVWKQSARNLYSIPEPENRLPVLLVLANEHDFSAKLINRLQELNGTMMVAISGSGYRKMAYNRYLFAADNRQDYEILIREMAYNGKKPGIIINLLGITNNTPPVLDCETTCGEKLFYSLLYLAQAFGNQGWNTPVQLKVLVNNSQKIFQETEIHFDKALHLGPCRVIPREYPYCKCDSIDFLLPESGSIQEQDLLDQLLAGIYTAVEANPVVYRGNQCWIQHYEKVLLGDNNSHLTLPLKSRGAYLITGGLGGLGLALAEYLVREVKAKLILINRSRFPEKNEWDQWLIENGSDDLITQKIKKLKQLEEMGSEILISQADITDPGQLKTVRVLGAERFGKIDGIIHAAGAPGGGMIQLKTKEFAENVLAPKVKGTMALYEAFTNNPPDFVIFCSSLNAITGGFGQIDYSAANAFLDSFAQAHDSRHGTRYLSINWDRWPGVGMAGGTGQQSGNMEKSPHPLLGIRINGISDKIIYIGELSPAKDWVLAEHLVMGNPTIAGATYLEMVRAAFEESTGRLQSEISEVVFLTPMVVKEKESRDVFLILNRNGDNHDFNVISRLHGEDLAKSNWQEHVRGRIGILTEETETQNDLNGLAAGCNRKTIDLTENRTNSAEEFISFGNRWRSLRSYRLGDNEGLVQIELNREFKTDLEHYKLHPALLDVATGSIRLASGGNYLPFSYESLSIRGRLPEKIYAHIRFKNGYDSHQEIMTSDIEIMNEQGTVIIAIKGFSMRLTKETAAVNIKTGNSGGSTRFDYSGLEKIYIDTQAKKSNALNEGLTVTEGREAFHRIIRNSFRPQFIVSTKDIHLAIEQANYIDQPGARTTFEEAAVTLARHHRPELDNEYVSPKNETEKKLVTLWQNLLGIEPVGIQDEFFSLGGDSLLLIQFHTKLKEMFQTDIAVVDLYKYNTVVSLAKYLNRNNSTEEQPAFQEVNQRANKQLELMQQRRQQMMQRRGVGKK